MTGSFSMSRSTLTLDICTAAGWATDFALGLGMEKEAAFLMFACARFICAPRFARFAGAFFEQHKCHTMQPKTTMPKKPPPPMPPIIPPMALLTAPTTLGLS